MAVYKKNCIHCGSLVDGDIQFCPSCGSASPFGYVCPSCRKAVEKGQRLCSACGRPLYVKCPFCGQETFVQEKCEACGKSLMKTCANRRCGQLQFFDLTKCTACGKKLR